MQGCLVAQIVAAALLGATTGALAAPAEKPQAPPHFPHMKLEAQFAGPLQDTIIQRWRDPQAGIICYIYMPVVVAHAPSPTGFVQYGSNGIGSISCVR